MAQDYDVMGALEAGLTPAQIADYLASKKEYDIGGARKAGLDDLDIISHLTKQPPGALTAMARGFARSVGEIGILGGDVLPALAASVLPESIGGEYARKQLKEAEVSRAKLEAKYPTAYESYKDVEGVGSAVGYAAERFGQILPDIVPSLLGGGAGYVAGKKLAQKAATEAAEQASKKVLTRTEQELAKSGLFQESLAGTSLTSMAENMAGEVGKRAAIRAADEVVAKYGTRGLEAGVFLGSYAQNAPEIFENIYQETGSLAPGGALLFGGLSAMLDSYLPAKVLGDLGAFGKNALVARMLKDSGADPVVWRSVLREGGKAALGEGLTETAQEGISVAAEKLYGSNKDFFSTENVQRYLESFFAGSIGGGGLGAASGVGKAFRAKEDAQRQALEEARQPGVVNKEVDQLLGRTAPVTPPAGTTPPGAPAAETTPKLSPLANFDLTKVDPAKVQTSQQILQDFQANKLTDAEGKPLDKLQAHRKLKSAVTSLGIPLKKGTSQKTPDLLSLLTEALTPKGAEDVTGLKQAGAGASTEVPGGPLSTSTTGQPATSTGVGVGVPAAGTAGVGAREGTSESALVDKKKELQERIKQAKQKRAEAKKGLPIGEEVADANIAALEAELRQIEGETEYISSNKALQQDYETARQEFGKVREEDVKEESKEEKVGRRALPEWGELSRDERMVYEDALQTHGRVLEEGQSIRDVTDRALEDLVAYRQMKGADAGNKNTALASYEINRQAESRYRGVEFPSWSALTDEQRKFYMDQVYSPEERTKGYAGPTYEIQQAGFDALEKTLGPEARVGYQREQEEAAYKRTEEAARERARQAQEAEELSLEHGVPTHVAKAIIRGDLKYVLDYLNEKGSGSRGIAAEVRRLVAGSLSTVLTDSKLGSPVKLVYDRTFTGIAKYDPKTNTILVGKRGFQEIAILHEAVHAATVRVIYTFLSGNRNLLSKEQQEAVTQLLRLMDMTKKRLGTKFSRAYKNIYEFVAYASTDPKFQVELKNMELAPSTRLIKYSNLPEDARADTAFDRFTRAIALALELPERFARMVKNVFSYAKYYELTKATEQEVDATVAELTGDMTGFEAAKEESKILKEIKEETKAQEQKVDAARELNKARQEFKSVSNKYQNQTAEQLNANEEFIAAKERYDNAQTAFDALKTDKDLEGLGVTVTREPGYLGNVLVEIFGALDQIMDAPPQEGIPNWDNKPLYIKAEEGGLKIEESEKRLKEKLDHVQTSSVSKVGKALKGVFTPKGYDNLIRAIQNKTIAFDRLVQRLDRVRKLRSLASDENFNDISVYYQGTALATNREMEFFPLTNEASRLMQRLMKKMKDADGKPLTYTGLLARLQIYMLGLNEPERRRTFFLREVPLTDSAEAKRQDIFKRVTGTMPKEIYAAEQANDQQKLDTLKQEAEQLYKDLEALVADPNNRANTDANLNDINYSKYNVLGYDTAEIRKAQAMYNEAVTNNPELEQLMTTLQQIMDKTQQINKEANYFSSGVQSIIWFYGWKSYFPFKGKEDPSGKFDQMNPYGERLSGDFARGENTFMGRQTDADNPVLQIFTEATRSALRWGYRDTPVAMANLIKQGHVAGTKKPRIISFEDRYKNGLGKGEQDIKQKSFFVYKPDGTIEVYDIDDREILRSFKGLYTPDTPIVDFANEITSKVGQFHTRYNPAFALWDFTRNLFSYAGVVSAEFGPMSGARIVSQLAKVVSQGGMHKTFKYTLAYNRGEIETLNKLRASDPDGYYKDIDDYYKLGGPVAYIQGLTAAQTQESLSKQVKAMKVAGYGAKEVQDFFDSWIATFETSTRIAAFRIIRNQLQQSRKDLSPDEINVRAMSKTKDLANFQKVGELGKPLGAMFMFWRPAATGAVKAIDALLPAFDTRTEAQLFEYYKHVTKDVSDAEAQAAVKDHIAVRDNARHTAYALAGAGAFVYFMALMMAGDDDEGRNKVLIDDMARWVRAARFNTGIEIGGKDLVFQMPWGFGPGALAAAGAQIAATAMGGQNLMSAASNIIDAGFESFMPLPTSKIDKMANPTAWAIDSITPSVLRPLLEFTMNTDGLGRKIYSDRQSRYADSYIGSDNVPSMWTDLARGMFKTTGIDVSPSSMYFFANNYFDGLTRALATGYNMLQVTVGDKDFDPRTDTFVLDSYFKAPSNYDAIQFSKAENKIKEIEKTLNALKGTPELAEYVAENPMAPQVVKFYNQTVNGAMRNIRSQMNTIRRSDMPPSEKQPLLTLLNRQQNQIKSAFTNAMAGLDEDFASFGYNTD